MKLLLVFLILIGLISGVLIGINSHELGKDDINKGDKVIGIINIIVGSILFLIGIGLLFFQDNMIKTGTFSLKAPYHARKSVMPEPIETPIFEPRPIVNRNSVPETLDLRPLPIV